MIVTALLAASTPVAGSAAAADMPVQDAPPATVPTPTPQEAAALTRAEDYAAAADAWERIVAADPDNGPAWFQLGFCRLLLDRYAASIDAFENAIEQDVGRHAAMYNITCAYALMNRPEEAIDWLEKAVEAGFNQLDLLATDPDLASLRGNPRFEKLHQGRAVGIPEGASDVMFPAADGVEVHGHLYQADTGSDAPMILLFHQAGSNKAEYFPIAPRLNELGFHCLAIDARGGAPRDGHPNRTADGYEPPRPPHRASARYLPAYADLEAALRYVRDEGFTGKVAAWGSGYSAGLVFRLARDHRDDIAAVLAFSPPPARHPALGGDAYSPVQWGAETPAAIFVTWPANELDESRRAFFDAIDNERRLLLEQAGGVHGSATLHEARNPEGWETNWKQVVAFLNEHGR